MALHVDKYRNTKTNQTDTTQGFTLLADPRPNHETPTGHVKNRRNPHRKPERKTSVKQHDNDYHSDQTKDPPS